VEGGVVLLATRTGVDLLSATQPLAGVLLTGGASRRLGIDKATLVVNGTRLADHAATVLAAVCGPVIEVGPGITGLPTCREDPAGSGPLAGLVAGAAALGSDASNGVLLLACDLPGVEEPLVRLVAHWPGGATVVPMADGEPQLVCARYGTVALAQAADVLGAGTLSLRRLLDQTEHDLIEPSTWGAVAPIDAFADIDTPADLARIRRGVDSGDR
jgi:molybdopterin-guanine dinucleotide biosynthesis protein A